MGSKFPYNQEEEEEEYCELCGRQISLVEFLANGGRCAYCTSSRQRHRSKEKDKNRRNKRDKRLDLYEI